MDGERTRFCLTTIFMFNFFDQFFFLGLIFSLLSKIFCFMLQVGDGGFFNWADNEMSTYERRIMQRLKDVKEHSRVEVRRLMQLMDIKLAKYKVDVEEKHMTVYRKDVSGFLIFNYFAGVTIC
jgi:hypothetical protein